MPKPRDPDPSGRTFPGTDPLSSAVIGSFMRVQHAHRQLMSRKMVDHGIPTAQIFCLKEIAHNDGITQRDLAEKLSVSRPTLTVMLQKMERTGLIERTSDADDQRFTRLHVSQRGAQLHESMHVALGQMVEEMAGTMTDEDKIELTRLLNLMYDNMTAAVEKPERSRT